MWTLSTAHQKWLGRTAKPLILGGTGYHTPIGQFPHRAKANVSFPNTQDPKVMESLNFLARRNRSAVVSVDCGRLPRDAVCAPRLSPDQSWAREMLASPMSLAAQAPADPRS